MQQTKIAAVFDPHFADKGPSTRIDDYSLTTLNKMQFIINYCNTNNVATLIIPGDLFHRKIPSHNSHFLIKNLISLFSEYKGKIFAIAGNHDYSGIIDNVKRQPISVLEQAGVITLLNPESLLLELDGIKISLAGKDFATALDSKDSAQLYNLQHQVADVRIGVFHQMILPDDQTFFNSYINFHDLRNINSDIVFNGHYHVGYQPAAVKYERENGGYIYFVNAGSMVRGSSDQFNLEKIPKFSLLTLSKVDDAVIEQFEEIEIPHALASEVFDMSAIAKKKENEALKKFVENLSQFEADSISTADPDAILNLLKVMGLPDTLRPLAQDYLEKSYERINA